MLALTKENYYLVLELPFDTLLVHYLGFAKLDDAEDLQSDKLPWFSIWSEEQLNAWTGEIILIPFKTTSHTTDDYVMQVTYKVMLTARTQFLAHKQLRNAVTKAGLAISDLTTAVVNKKINLRSKDG